MTSKQEHADTVINLIGGQETLEKLKAKKLERLAEGLRFWVPILGGLVRVDIARVEQAWDIDLGIDYLETAPRRIEMVPDENLKLIVHHLFVI